MVEPIRWRWGLVAALALTLLAMFPQLYLWHERGGSWQGANAFFYTDEPAYAAYVNALKDGKPRRNDPYTGRYDNKDATLPESLFSIQFATAYLVALPARALGLSTATAFILLSPLVAFAASLALFWLLAHLTNDERTAAAFVPFVLCLGILLSGNGLVRGLLGQQTRYVYLPFLRRYNPAVSFPCFILFFLLTWLALTGHTRRKRILYALGAAAAFALCVYGYFFLWTAAAAWLVITAMLWLLARPDGWRQGLASCVLIGLLALAVLVPYANMLSHRAESMDTVQALVHTHAPDLWRSIEGIALVILAALAIGLKRKRINWADRRVLIALAFAVLPVVLFNQQIITGRSLQPMHYEQFVAGYITLIAAALAATLMWRGQADNQALPLSILLLVACLSYGWGAGETWIATRRFARANVLRDEARPVALRLREVSLNEDATSGSPVVVFAPDVARADTLPMVAPQAVLWAPHMFVFSGVTVAENRERFFQYLYYSGVGAEEFVSHYLRQGFVSYAIFGWERANPHLTVDYKPISDEELASEARNYADYISHFDRTRATHPQLSYLLVGVEQPINLTHLDQWYMRDGGEHIGTCVLYRLNLRP
ncbi:MAG: hypothetical protein ABI967_15000 [bacterium]